MKWLMAITLLSSMMWAQAPPIGRSGPAGCEDPGIINPKTGEWTHSRDASPRAEGTKWTQPWEQGRTFTCIKGRWFNAELEALRKKREAEEKHDNDLRTAMVSRPLTKQELLEVVKRGSSLWYYGSGDAEQAYWRALLQQFLIRQIENAPDCTYAKPPKPQLLMTETLP